ALATYVSIFSVVFLALFLAALFLAAFFLAAGFAIRSSLTGLPGPDRERRIIPCSSIKVYQTDCSSRFPARAGIVSARRQHPCQPVQLFAELLVGLLGLGVEVASPSELLEARGELQGAVGCEIAGGASQGVRCRLQRGTVAPGDGVTHLIPQPRGVGDEKMPEILAADAASVLPGRLRPGIWREVGFPITGPCEALDQLDQLLGPDRLGEIGVHSRREAALAVSLEGMGGQGDDRDVGAGRLFPGADRGGRLEAVHLR